MLTIDEKKNNKTFVHPTKHDTIYYTTPQRSLAPPRLGTSSAKCLLGSVTTEKKTTTFKRAFIWAECITPEYQTSVSEGKGKEKSGKKEKISDHSPFLGTESSSYRRSKINK